MASAGKRLLSSTTAINSSVKLVLKMAEVIVTSVEVFLAPGENSKLEYINQNLGKINFCLSLVLLSILKLFKNQSISHPKNQLRREGVLNEIGKTYLDFCAYQLDFYFFCCNFWKYRAS
jgi:hypothetical protein